MKPNPLIITVAAALLGVWVVIAAAAKPGPDHIDIYGGTSGKVPFPHA